MLGKPFWGVAQRLDPPAFAAAAAAAAAADAAAAAAKLPPPDAADAAADAALRAELLGAGDGAGDGGGRALSITGMDGFFRYDLLYGRLAYQFHEEGGPGASDNKDKGKDKDRAGDSKDKEKAGGDKGKGKEGAGAAGQKQAAAAAAAGAAAGRVVTERWTMGVFDAAATRAAREEDARAPRTRARQAWGEARAAALAAAKASAAAAAGDAKASAAAADAKQQQKQQQPAAPVWPAAPPPMLEALDLLPDQPAMLLRAWPFVRQLYTRGDACGARDRPPAPRRVELRAACSPDARLHMLVREPDFCR